MHSLLQQLADLVWPAQPGSRASSAPLDVYLKPFVILVIVVLVGPDLFALVELSTLLDLLGATMFVFAFAVAFRLLVIGWLKSLHRVLVPLEYSWLVELRGRPSAVIFGVLFSSRMGIVLVTLGFASYVGIAELIGIAA